MNYIEELAATLVSPDDQKESFDNIVELLKELEKKAEYCFCKVHCPYSANDCSIVRGECHLLIQYRKELYECK